MSDIKSLVERLKKQCAGRERWYVMNAEEDGYIIDFDWQLDADQWMDRYMRENPDFIKRNGYHIVKRKSFTANDELINEAVSALEAAIARIVGLERDAGRYRWLRNEHFPTADNPPLAQVVWKELNDRNGSLWANMIDGNDLDHAIDAALAASEPKKEPT